MKNVKWMVAALLVAAPLAVYAAELRSGLQAGQPINAFDVVKCSGAPNDGVAVGDELCYRCKYGGRPMVMVFARDTGGSMAALVQQLDAAVAANQDKQLRAFVNVLGSNRDSAEEVATKLGSENVPAVVPVEFENGPADYGINPEAAVTVIVASGSKVVASHGYGAALTADDVTAILADVNGLVK